MSACLFWTNSCLININWTIHPKSRIGLVGDNGTGKTTLFRAILDQVHLDSGFIDIPDRKQKKIGYLPQDLVELEATGLIEYLRKKSGIAALEESIQDLEQQISQAQTQHPGIQRTRPPLCGRNGSLFRPGRLRF